MLGKFISFEGNDGSGKTSIITRVSDYFTAKGYDVLVTREPGGIRISEKIRDILLDKEHTEMDARTEALLFAASRRQHLVEKILPALKQGKLVLCDRFVDSSLVFQGIGRHLGVEEVFAINQFAIENRLPDLTVFVDVTPEIALARIFKNAGREVNRLDLETEEFHHQIYNGYQEILKRFPDRIKAVNGEGTIGEVAKATIVLIEKYL
jgi:dTMP kinase